MNVMLSVPVLFFALVAVHTLCAGVTCEASVDETPRFGVNYMLPCSGEYQRARRDGLDIDRQIAIDVGHMRRLGLNLVRIHFFDMEASTADGALVDNGHVAALDSLIACCATNRIGVLLTPIAWWGRKDGRKGFSSHYTMPQMTSLPAARTAQCRFLREFAAHVNRVTGLRYADDSAVLGFECINEPMYAEGSTDEEKTAYVNALVAALKSTGTAKPVYYNPWCGAAAAVARSTVDGVSGNCYPNGGHGADRFVCGPMLGLVDGSSLEKGDLFAGKRKMVYEFDAADTLTGYMYPAIAASLRAEGVSLAAQFAYDVLPFADENGFAPSHYLNLVYTPTAALSMAIAKELFTWLPSGTPYAPTFDRFRAGPFSVDAVWDSSEYASDTAFLYANGSTAVPPAPARLARVWGVGSSPVVRTTGNGCFFLDRAAEGVWRLQLYPSVRLVADPFKPKDGEKKAVVLADEISLTLDLPDLGTSYSVRTRRGGSVMRAQDGRVTLPSGDYALVRDGVADASAAWAFDVPPYVAPAPYAGNPPPAWRPQAGEAHAEISVAGFIRTRNATCSVVLDGADFNGISDDQVEGFVLRLQVRATRDETTRMEVQLDESNNRSWTAVVPISTEQRWVDVPLTSFVCRRRDAHGRRVPDIRRVRKVTLRIGRWLFPQTADRPHGLVVTGVAGIRPPANSI